MYNQCAKRAAQWYMHYIHCKPTCFGECSLFASMHPIRKKKGPLQSWKTHLPGHCFLFSGLHCPEKQLTDGINMYESPKHKAWPTLPSPCTACSAALHCFLPTSWWLELSERQRGVYSFIFFCADRSAHASNLQHIGLEVTVNILSQMEREECLQLWKNLGLINAWENITTSALNFLL